LLRSVGWLSRQDLSTRSGPAGPALETPGAQLPGEHTFRLALYPHAGDWLGGDVHAAAEAYAVPLRGAGAREHGGDLPPAGGALAITPSRVQLSSLASVDGRIECRVYNPSADAVDARLHVGAPLTIGHPATIDLFGREIAPLAHAGDVVTLPMRAHEIVTVRLR